MGACVCVGAFLELRSPPAPTRPALPPPPRAPLAPSLTHTRRTQISAKAYGAARDTNMRVDEAKWVAYKLYRNAKDQFERRQPPEKRIVEYLCCLQGEWHAWWW